VGRDEAEQYLSLKTAAFHVLPALGQHVAIDAEARGTPTIHSLLQHGSCPLRVGRSFPD